MTMIKITKHYRIIFLPSCFIWVVLISAGCAHIGGPGKEFAEQTVQASSVLEKRGDLVNAVEELKVALAADPYNSNTREELDRLLAKRNLEVERYYKSGVAMRDSNPLGARKAFLAALKIRSDYPEVVTALRGLQLEAAEAKIQARTKREAKLAATRVHAKTEADEDEMDGVEYSLDIAISAFESGDYNTAIREFGKMKARYPNDTDIQLYLDRSWYNSGIASFTKKDFHRALTSFAKVPKGFERVDEYVAKCRLALKIPEGEKVKQAPKKRR
jgi:tetratricopeptide (TPR) repeat protein